MEISIRPFKKEDRDFVRYLCCETAFSGEKLENFFEGREVIADLLTMYFTDYEPESLFIAEIDGIKAGYLTGCRNIRKHKRIFKRKVLPIVVKKFLLSGALLKKKNIIFLYNCAKSFFKKEIFDPDFSNQYPAILHINVASEYTKSGIGKRLIEQYCDYLIRHNVKGIHLTTVSENAKGFFQKMGFVVLHKRKISYFEYLRPCFPFRFTMGKKLI